MTTPVLKPWPRLASEQGRHGFSIAPDRAALLKQTGLRALVVVGIIVLGVYRSYSSGTQWTLWISLAILVLGLGSFALYCLNTRYRMTEPGLEYRNLLGIKKLIPAARLATAVAVLQYTANNRTGLHLFLLDPSGQRMAHLSAPNWSAGDMYGLVEALPALGRHVIEEPVTQKALKALARYPGLGKAF